MTVCLWPHGRRLPAHDCLSVAMDAGCQLMTVCLSVSPMDAGLLCPLPSTRARSSSCSLSHWCDLTISSSVTLFSFCLQSFPASGSFPLIRLFASGSQSIGASASASVLPILSWFPLGSTGSLSLQPKGLSTVFSSTTAGKHPFFWCSAVFMVQLLRDHWKNRRFDCMTFVVKVMSLFLIHCLSLP